MHFRKTLSPSIHTPINQSINQPINQSPTTNQSINHHQSITTTTNPSSNTAFSWKKLAKISLIAVESNQ
jgi:hypothetical protein